MSGQALLIAVGGMLVLTGLVVLATDLAGIRWTSERGRRARISVHVSGRWLAAIGVGLIVLLLTGWIAAAAGAAGAVVLIPTIWTNSSTDLHIARLEALASWTRRLADLLRSGAASSLDSALVKSATVAPEPIKPELAALAARIGPQGTRAALLAFAAEMADPVSDEVVMALTLQLRHGGRGLAQVLSGLAGTVDDEVRMRHDVQADRAKYRSNARTIVGLFAVMSAGMILFARTFLAPYGTPVGQIALTAVVAVFGAALLWLRQMIRQHPNQRLLSDADLANTQPTNAPPNRPTKPSPTTQYPTRALDGGLS